MGWTHVPPIPPSEGQDGKLHELRFLGQVKPDQPVQKGYGNLYILGLLAAVSVVFMGAAFYLGVEAQSGVRVSVSDVTAELGPCLTWPNVGNGQQAVNYAFTLTNTGTRDAVVLVDLYANGSQLASAGPFTVPAGQSVTAHASATQLTCGPVSPTVVLRTVSAAS